jgi:hypothetical protein
VPAILIFDGDCGFCTTCAHWAQRRFRQGERAQAWQLLGDEVLERPGGSMVAASVSAVTGPLAGRW